jgi:hypothetical protein
LTIEIIKRLGLEANRIWHQKKETFQMDF